MNDKRIILELFTLKVFLQEFEDFVVEVRSKAAAKELSEMTGEERRMLSMTPDEKEFFIKFILKNPDYPWYYFKEYQKKIQAENNLKKGNKFKQKEPFKYFFAPWFVAHKTFSLPFFHTLSYDFLLYSTLIRMNY